MDGSKWDGVTSGGTFTKLEKVIYVDSVNGNDNNEGHRISNPKASIKAAVDAINNDATFGDGSVVLVAPGVYQEAAPIDIQKRDVAIIGASVRNVIVHPTAATETSSLFRVNSGTYLHNMTFTGMKLAVLAVLLDLCGKMLPTACLQHKVGTCRSSRTP